MEPARRTGVAGSTALARSEVRLALAPDISAATCTGCGHGRQAHQHYRRGTDCALCDCDQYRRSLLTWLLRTR